jgi:hypothetical protein
MARFSVAPAFRAAASLWLATADVARMLQMSRYGVWWLAKTGGLPCVRTPSGQLLFLRSVVLEVVERRAKARVRSRDEVYRALRIVRARSEPRQLALPLFGEAKKRKVTQRSMSETGRVAEEKKAVPIRTATLPGGRGDKRMAKAEGYGRSECGTSVGRRRRA